MKNILKI